MHTDERALKAFGHELRRLRGETELTQKALARRVSQRGTTISDSHVSDIENGRATARPWLRKLLDEILESDGRLERFWEELTGSGRQVWLHEVTKRTHAADALFEYQPLVFPGYLQTQDYSYALIRYGAPWLSQEQVLSLAKERSDRAKRMAEAASPVIWLIIDQSVLWRRYGSPQVQRDQLAYVAQQIERERITVQMLPVRAPRHPGTSGPRRIITTADEPEVVYMESAEEGRIISGSADISRSRMVFTALQGASRGPQETLQAIYDEMKVIDDE
ncbi:helix-turn-helix domain-containing protein [Nocardiopsis dassonvillei]|uniref:helix-turn-helix domain-containing protein n=1 Tax=Nocardiopsis dassonvillei TaxID=2014 RepID=UPI00102C4F9C|nr:helix-turn-helix transcriptional regulator [Nocardiopsis dassonvillei]MCP3014858.1 helix-turn-helix domain-containing protein [Nocardiopsis dassonvillei]